MGKKQKVRRGPAQAAIQTVWESLSPKSLCPQSKPEKWGFRANPLGLMSHRFRQERRKIPRPEAPRPGREPKETGGGGNAAGQPAHAPTTSPPEEPDRAVCVLGPPSAARLSSATPIQTLSPGRSERDRREPGRGTGGRRGLCGPHLAPLTPPPTMGSTPASVFQPEFCILFEFSLGPSNPHSHPERNVPQRADDRQGWKAPQRSPG